MDLVKPPGRRRGDRLGAGARGARARRGDGGGRARDARLGGQEPRRPAAVEARLPELLRERDRRGARPSVVGFGRALRAAGLPVGTGRLLAFREAAGLVRSERALLGRAGDARRPAGGDPGLRPRLPARSSAAGPRSAEPLPSRRAPPDGGRGRRRPAARRGGGSARGGLASRVELLRRKSFSRCSPEELAALARLMARLDLAAPERRTRRRGPARAGRPRPAADAAPRAAHRRRAGRAGVARPPPAGAGGSCSSSTSPARWPRTRARSSCSPTPRCAADQRFEAFSFGTRLTRLTRPLPTARPDEALRRAAARERRLGRRHPHRRLAEGRSSTTSATPAWPAAPSS